MKWSLLPSLLVVAGLQGGAAKNLTNETWDEETAGKHVFLMFWSHFDGHCNDMKPNWDLLASEYSSSKHVGIYDVDCHSLDYLGQDLCNDVRVANHPTIKYGDPHDRRNLKTYYGGHDLDALRKFAADNLEPLCGPASMDACTGEERAMLEGFLARPSADLVAEAEQLDEAFRATQRRYDDKALALRRREGDYQDDVLDHKRFKRVGKEAEHKAKADKLKRKKARLEKDKQALNEKEEVLKTEMAKSGVRLMKLAAVANKDKTDL